MVNGLRIKDVKIQADALPYSWGNASNGKLGISDDYVKEFYQENLNQFYTEDTLENDYLDQDGVTLKPNSKYAPNSTKELENLRNLNEFDKKVIFTPKP